MRERRGLLLAGRLVVCFFVAMLCLGSGWTDSPILAWSGNGHYYQVVGKWLSWPDAKAAAEARGGYLVTITSQAEQDWIVGEFINAKRTMCWMGLYQDTAPSPGAWAPDEHWHWVTGEPLAYTNWRQTGPKEPNDARPPEDNQENFGHITDINGYWNDLQAAWYAYIAYMVEWDSDPLAPAPPKLSWLNAEGYQTDGVDPGTGDPMATSFAFRALYRDVNGDPPRFVNLLLRGQGSKSPPRILGMSGGGGRESSGVVYRRTLRLPSGAYEYRFQARDRDGWATGEPTQWHTGPVIGSLPSLAWLGTPGYESGGVDPEQGTARETRFVFKVLYADADGHQPLHVTLYVRRNDQAMPFREVAMRKGVGSYVDGVAYRCSLTLPPGAYRYRFAAQDRNGRATGAPTRWTRGPVLAPGGAVALAALAAVPTHIGVQVAFTLSEAAQVQVRVLNLAGRPVRVLCTAKDCEAGAVTLIWNAQADNGLPVPSGTYLVEVRAKASDGAQARGLAQVRISR